MLLHVTIDHQAIFAWAQRKGACPSTFEGDDHPWPLFFCFGSPGMGLEEISWDRFFLEFERADLAFIYRDGGPNGELDDLARQCRRWSPRGRPQSSSK
jgi:hypothetical protein